MGAFFVQLVRSLNVAKNEAEVGYYVGIMVSARPAWTTVIILKWRDLAFRNPYPSLPRRARSCIGVDSRITSAESQLF